MLARAAQPPHHAPANLSCKLSTTKPIDKQSTLAPVPAGLWNYDANDRFTAGDTYDNNGNTASSGGIANVYDFENHLIQNGGVTIVYDGDGNRVSKTVAGVTTTYLVDTLNPTGYAQVLAESFAGARGARELSHNYVYGLELISQARHYFTGTQSLTQTIYYVYDGHGSVRALTGPTGAVTDTYDYDAFGNLILSTGTTPNNYLFAGEQFDPDLNLYYNRARYLNVTSGRFWTMDTDEGIDEFPGSLHKYLYVESDPVNMFDPTGNDDIAELGASFAISSTTNSLSALNSATSNPVQHFPWHAKQTGSTATFFHDTTPGPLPDGYGRLLCTSCYGAVRFYNYQLTDANESPFTETAKIREFLNYAVSSDPINASLGEANDAPAGKFSDTLDYISSLPRRSTYFFKTEQTFTVDYGGQSYPLTTKVNQYIARIQGEWLISAVVIVP